MVCSYSYRQNRFYLVTEKSGGRWATLVPSQRPHPTRPTSPCSGAGAATSHTGCRLPARGCQCPWPRGSAWRNTASADPARTSQRFLSGKMLRTWSQLVTHTASAPARTHLSSLPLSEVGPNICAGHEGDLPSGFAQDIAGCRTAGAKARHTEMKGSPSCVLCGHHPTPGQTSLHLHCPQDLSVWLRRSPVRPPPPGSHGRHASTTSITSTAFVEHLTCPRC